MKSRKSNFFKQLIAGFFALSLIMTSCSEDKDIDIITENKQNVDMSKINELVNIYVKSHQTRDYSIIKPYVLWTNVSRSEILGLEVGIKGYYLFQFISAEFQPLTSNENGKYPHHIVGKLIVKTEYPEEIKQKIISRQGITCGISTYLIMEKKGKYFITNNVSKCVSTNSK